MPKPIKKREPYQYADRFYDYLIEHRAQVLRYITAALVTSLIQFVLERVFPANGGTVLLPTVARFFMLFYTLKYWVYKEAGTGFFYTARQFMIAMMAVITATWVFYQLILLLEALFNGGALLTYIAKALLEVCFFVLYQFCIFKPMKKD